MAARFYRRRRRRWSLWVGAAAILAVLAAAAAWLHPLPLMLSPTKDAHTPASGLRIEDALRPLLKQALGALIEAGSPGSGPPPARLDAPWETIRHDLAVRADAAVRPIFFVGVVAKLQGGQEWAPEVRAAWGTLYFEADGKRASLELTLRETSDGFALSRLWNWQCPVEVPGNPEADAEAALKSLGERPNVPEFPGKLLHLRPTIVRFIE